MISLKPFWRYYGGKWRAAPRYPMPIFDTIVEPFAGAAGYSLRYPDRKIILVEKYAIIAEIWRYLINVSPSEIRRIPLVDSIMDLPQWVPQGGRYLVGFTMNAANTSPRISLSAGHKKQLKLGRKHAGWSEAQRERVASQVDYIRHWKIIEGDYTDAPDIPATWFVDPPYSNKAGSYYVHSVLDYRLLLDWCRTRKGQIMVCENDGATWAPFKPFSIFKSGLNGHGSKEVFWKLNR